MWWLYWKWQWVRDLHMQHQAVQQALALLFLGLGLFGGYVHYKRDPKSFWFFGPFVFTVTLLFVFLLNFKLGWTQARLPGMDPSLLAEVRDRDYFFLWGFSALGVWIALALATFWTWLAEAAARGRELTQARWAWALASPVLLIGLVPLILNANHAPRNDDTVARDWAIDVLNSVEPYGVLITGGDNDTYPLWYAQEVEGVRRDVTVAVTSLLNTDWYVRQMIRRPIYPYDVDTGPAVYRDREWPIPDGPPINVPLAAVESLPPYMILREPAQMRKDSLVATIQPGVVSRDQLVVLSIIKDSFPERPLFIARSTGGYAETLGLEPYMLTQGMVRKVMPAPIEEGPGLALVAGEGWVDVNRSAALWEQSYRGNTALTRLDDWMDRASANIPFIYVNTAVLIAEGLTRQGETTRAEAVYAEAEQIVQATRLEGLFGRGRGGG
jgi:hypothetical protein